MTKVQRGRAGWSEEEEKLLFDEIESCESSGKPLKAVFAAVAEKTGRKPNSIRNYYYARIKERDLSTAALHAGAFVPFSQDEIRYLLRTVLSAQANGISVRACTMSMGGGDNKAMLRYQNKYRALLKNRPRLVKQVAEELRAEGVDFDPYKTVRSRGGKGSVSGESFKEAARKLDRIDGMDSAAFIKGLNRLAELASNGSGARVSELTRRVTEQEQELLEQQNRFHALLVLYRSLVSANRELLRSANISPDGEAYLRLLSSVADGEKALLEYNA